MRIRSILAAATLTVAAATASAAIGDIAKPPLPDAQNFPRPMPGRIIVLEKPNDFWQNMRDLIRPKLVPVLPAEFR